MARRISGGRFRKGGEMPSPLYYPEMMLTQAPKSLQFQHALVVRSGDDGPAAEEQPPHAFGSGDSCCLGLLFFYFLRHSRTERPPPLKAACRLPLFHLLFLPF